MAGGIHRKSARGKSGIAVVGISVVAFAFAGLRVPGGFRAHWKGTLKLFEIYFLHSMEYRAAIKLVGVADGTFDYWSVEVKRAVGRELSRCKLFPPSKYFQG